MRILGIISEYDPFHNGHKYMLQKLRAELEADAAVCVMSGEFTQRGMPAYFDKMTRAEMAVRGGIDLVVELPYIYACNSGAEFAKGGIGILKGLGCVTDIGFGAETDNTEALIAAAEAEEDEDVSASVRRRMREGVSHAEALTSAFELRYGKEIAELLRHPNNLLAIEYLRAMRVTDASFMPIAVKRRGAAHGGAILKSKATEKKFDRAAVNDGDIINSQTEQVNFFDSIKNFASGSEIRRRLTVSGGSIDSVKELLPDTSFELLGKGFNAAAVNKLYELLVYKCITSTFEELSNILEINEGLENRIKKSISESASFDELIMSIKSKRYTMSRIRRMLMHILMNIGKSEFNSLKGTYYARILAFNSKGAELIRKATETSEIPIISNLNRISRYPETVQRCLAIDGRAVDLYDMLSENGNCSGRDRRIIPIRYFK